jgi:hypothetical protein
LPSQAFYYSNKALFAACSSRITASTTYSARPAQ